MPLDGRQLYSEAGTMLRHYLDWREKLLGGYLALVGALAVAAWAIRGTDHAGAAISFLVVPMTVVFWLLERRNRALLGKCVDTGVALERDASLKGVFTEINEAASGPTHSNVLDWFFGSAIVVASILAVVRWWAPMALWWEAASQAVPWLRNGKESSLPAGIASAVSTFIALAALVFTAWSAHFAAGQLRLNRTIAKHQFLLQFFELVQGYNDIHVRLRGDDGASWEPPSAEEWNRVRRYVALLGTIRKLVSDGIFDVVSADEDYSHRVAVVLRNSRINQMIYEEEDGWPQFKALVEMLRPQRHFRLKAGVEPKPAHDGRPPTNPQS